MRKNPVWPFSLSIRFLCNFQSSLVSLAVQVGAQLLLEKYFTYSRLLYTRCATSRWRSEAKKWTRQTLFPSCSRKAKCTNFSSTTFYVRNVLLLLLIPLKSRVAHIWIFLSGFVDWNLFLLPPLARLFPIFLFSVLEISAHDVILGHKLSRAIVGDPRMRSTFRVVLFNPLESSEWKKRQTEFVAFDTARQTALALVVVRYRQAFSVWQKAKQIPAHIGIDVNE